MSNASELELWFLLQTGRMHARACSLGYNDLLSSDCKILLDGSSQQTYLRFSGKVVMLPLRYSYLKCSLCPFVMGSEKVDIQNKDVGAF